MAPFKNCKSCRAPFEIMEVDLEFYDRVSPVFGGKKYAIPSPQLCPSCRWQRRLAFRNERTLYHRKCDFTGKAMISMHPADTIFPVFAIQEWLNDKWNPLDYGRDFDFSRPFFEQFKEMCDQIPHFNLFIDPIMDVNSQYTNCSSEAKNCYLISQAEKNEDCLYSRGINTCKDCVDCLRIHHSELCYEGINLSQCYRCFYCQDCESSSDCFFSTNLKGCRNCFGSHGLVQKEYTFFNEPLSKEEWEKRVRSFVFTPKFVEEMKQKSEGVRLTVPHRATHITQCENVTGDHLLQCKNSHEVFDSKNLEGCAYCYEILNGAKDCYDYSMWGLQSELLYECNGCGYNAYHLLFSNHCWQNVSNLIYCESCFPSVKDCFGCFGLRRNQYCILNKQYTKEQYEILVPKIIKHMRMAQFSEQSEREGEGRRESLIPEWGEFFPMEISPYPYQDSLAQGFFPRLIRHDQQQDDYIGPTIEIPENIQNVSNEITQQILRCKQTGKLYKITPQELRFYGKMGLPIPYLCPEERHEDRMAKRNPNRLWERCCEGCGQMMKTTYAPDRSEKVYCESCYLKIVY